MAMQYDVKSQQLIQDDELQGRWRLKGLLISTKATGVIEISDGGPNTDRFSFNAVAGAAGNVYVAIPGEGILFTESIYIKRLTDASITVFYG